MGIRVSTNVLFVASCLLSIELASGCTSGTTYSLNRTNTCSNEATPCYNYTLTFIKDGISIRERRVSEIVAHHEKAGRSEADAVMKGKRVTAWLKGKYGIDFTNVPDQVYLDGAQAVTTSDKKLTFRAYIVSASARHRLISASRRDKAEFFNSPISEAGWMVTANEDYTATGEFNGVLPKGAVILYGDYVLTMCRDRPESSNNQRCHYKPCLFQFHRATLVIHYESNTFSLFDSNGVSVIDFVVKENTLGVGVARGVCFGGPGNKVDCRNVLTFPASV